MLTGIILVLLSVVAIYFGDIICDNSPLKKVNWLPALEKGFCIIGFAGLIGGVFVMFTGRALAAEAIAPTADLRPLWGYGVEIIGGGLSLLAGIATKAVTKHLKLKDQDRTREYLERAMQLGVQYAMELAIQNGQNLAQVNVRNEIVASAATYAAKAVPDALRAFNIDRDGLKDRLRARLPEIIPHPKQPSAFGQVGDAG